MLLLAFLTSLANASPTVGWWLPNPYADDEEVETREVCEPAEVDVSDELQALLDKVDALLEEAKIGDVKAETVDDGFDLDAFIEEAGWSVEDPLRFSVFYEEDACEVETPGHRYIDGVVLRPWTDRTRTRAELNSWILKVLSSDIKKAGPENWRNLLLLRDGASGRTFMYLDCFPEKVECPKGAKEDSKDDKEQVDIKPIRLELSA